MFPYSEQDSSPLRQALYIACAICMLSYVLFDILDLDGSDFPLKPVPIEKTIVVAEVPKEIKQFYSPARTEFWVDGAVLFAVDSGESAPVQFKRVPDFTALDAVRRRGYRLALPRSSIEAPSDPF